MLSASSSPYRDFRNFYEERYRTDYQLESPRLETFRVKAILSRIPMELTNVLDYGCGQGSKIAILEEMLPSSRIVGIDISNEAIKKASRRFPHHQFAVFDGGASPFQDQSFDLVFSSHVLEHVWNLEETVQDMSRLVRNGGCLCAILPCGNPGSVEERVVRVVNGEEFSKSNEMRWFYEDEGHLRRIKSNRLIEDFEKNGLRLLHEAFAFQSWDGVLYICTLSPVMVNRMFTVHRGRTILERLCIVALKSSFLFGSFLFWPLSKTPMEAVFHRIWVKGWNEHNRERNGSEQFLIFQKVEEA